MNYRNYSDDVEIQQAYEDGYNFCYTNGLPPCYNENPYMDNGNDREKFKAYEQGNSDCWNEHNDIRESYEEQMRLYD